MFLELVVDENSLHSVRKNESREPITQSHNKFVPYGQATSALMWAGEGEEEGGAGGSIARAPAAATREARYIDLMRTMQFGECARGRGRGGRRG